MAQSTVKPFSSTEERFGDLALRIFSKLNVWAYRASGGKIGGRFIRGAPVTLLTTIGRKSGKPRTAPLLYLENGDDVVIVASKAGMSRHPLWYRNLVENPEVEIEIGRRKRKMSARRASEEEKSELWPRLVRMYPDFDHYQARTDRDIPVVILSPS